MPRRRTFDREEVLHRAMLLFWERGFEAASVQELTTAMGINRFSMYNTFGDKQTLFLSALDHYTRDTTAPLRLPFDAPRPDLATIRAYFDAFIAHTSPRGCLMAAAASERPHDADTIARVDAHNAHTRLAFERALRGAADSRQLRPDIYPRRRAALLTTFALGLALQARAGAAPTTLRAAVDAVLSDLTAQRPMRST